jgi:murein DD-endopeptidase MepM/ murein hydrolase activator NlpD
MQIMITHTGQARTRVFSLGRFQLLGLGALLSIGSIALAAMLYHFVFVKAVREGWPVVSQLVRFVARNEFAQRDLFMRQNLNAMAQRVGEMQAKIIKLEVVGERVSTLAGVKPDEAAASTIASKPKVTVGAPSHKQGGQGGPFVSPAPGVHADAQMSLEQLNQSIAQLQEESEHRADTLILAESRLFEKRLTSLMIPNSPPVVGSVGSGFGFRSDPFTGRSALHTGLDFPSESGSIISAAAGGVVQSVEVHPAYGNLLEIDHGNGLLTRYAHTAKILVNVGDVIKRGQHVAHVGSTGRSTGAHLHFEVLVEGVPQDPAKFLSGKVTVSPQELKNTTAM